MKAFTSLCTLLLLGSAQGQYGNLWNGGAFNPWNNPNHPANQGIARGIAARNFFPWPGAPFIRPGFNPSNVADHAAIEELPGERRGALVELTERKNEIDAKIRDAALGRDAIGAGFRPRFVSDLIEERRQLVHDIRKAQREAVRENLARVAKRREIAKELAESNEPITFGLLMRSLHRAYGQEMAANSMAHQRKILEKFDRPFLRPVISMFAPMGLPSGALAETKIYQNLKEQKGTLLKDEDIFIVTKLSGFSGDKLHLSVDLHAVNETAPDTEALSEDFLQTELEFQDEMLESQLTASEKLLEMQWENTGKQSALQEKLARKRLDRAEKVEELRNKLAERQRDREQKLAEKHRDNLEKEFEKEQKAAEKQRDLLEKKAEKQRDLLKKQLEKDQDFREKLLEREARAAEKLEKKSKKEEKRARKKLEKEQKMSEKQGDTLQKLQEKAAEEASKRQEKEADLLEKQREKEQKLAEKEEELLQKRLEKEQDKALKLLEKEREKAEKQAEKDRESEEKRLEKEKKLAEKQLEKELKELEKENDLLERQLIEYPEQRIETLPIADVYSQNYFAHQQMYPFIPRFGPPHGF
ncbi:calponin homology domain-containing protein DDB_G0272472 [Galendromus occidentalis]|uniref:Calponin homology domain-containing protein DDB_G0272472 n=1 Tax=Galendromus occidentalis TaxID=34638 RepID=A0AAJ6QU05_9ACAR|nr:calponin homology domain-containing protein DDB_G0272472 [Galendromus occidentalis]